MPSRVLALFLAVVLLWSGLSTIEPLRSSAPASPAQQHMLVDAGGPAALADGSVEDHHLDDLPSQAQGDATSETTGLLPTPLKAGIPSLAMARSQTFQLTVMRGPFLAGPLRPPCRANLTA